MVACLAWGRKPCLGSTPAGRAVGLARQGASWAAWAGAVLELELDPIDLKFRFP